MSNLYWRYLETDYTREEDPHILFVFLHGIVIKMEFKLEEYDKALDVYDVVVEEMKLNWKYSK